LLNYSSLFWGPLCIRWQSKLSWIVYILWR